MKKIMIILAIIIVPLVFAKNMEEETIVIPKDSIRIRVIANSNALNDQYEKLIIKEKIQAYLQELLKDATSKEETESIIKKNILKIEKTVENTLEDINSKVTYNINYGYNYFPSKEYKGITYDSGFYDSLVITLGKGQGNNWWCVLFPPLCLMETEENMSDAEYKLYITEVLEKYQ